MRRAGLVMLLAGCGFRITSGSSSGDGGANDAIDDGAVDDGTLDDGQSTIMDGPTDGMPMDVSIQPTCLSAWINNTIQFDTPAAITPLNTASFERDPFLSPDELTIWFSNGGQQSMGGADVFVSTRATRGQPFPPPARDARFSTTGGAESKMSMTLDGLYAVMASNQSGGSGGADIWETSRANLAAMWGPINRNHTSGIDTANNELDPFVSQDGLRLYYAPAEPMPQHIVVAKRTSLTDPFAGVQDVVGITSTSQNGDPMVFGGDRVIVFFSTRPTPNGNDTSGNIWYATRASAGVSFGTPALVPGVNTDGVAEGDPHVSPDGCRIYFARNVGGGVDYELFSASSTL